MLKPIVDKDHPHLGGYLPGGDPLSYVPWVWEFLLNVYHPRTVLDVGCGEGQAAKWFEEHGVMTFGVDGCEQAKRDAVIAQDKFILHDYTKSTIPGQQLAGIKIDLIWSCEFVEHVEEQYVANIIDTFKLADVVAFTHALPHQDGYHHVNCQLPGYWFHQMANAGFELERLSTGVSRTLNTEAAYHYWNKTGFIFSKR